MSTDDKLANISFISIPETLSGEFNNFKIDPSVLLPVELEGEITSGSLQDLSWEMIISATLKILAYDPFHKDADYYREFITAVKPEIIEELTTAGIVKAENNDFEIAEEIFLALSNLQETETTVSNLALIYEQHADTYKKTGNEELFVEYLKKAEAAYGRFSLFEEVSENVLYNLAFFKIKTGKLNQAHQLLEQFVEKSENKKKIQKAKKAIEIISRETRFENDFQDAYQEIKEGNELSGIKKVKSFLKNNPNVWNGWFLLGWAYRKQEDYIHAREAFLKALKLEQNFADIYNELSICSMELNNMNESRDYLLKALEIEPDNIKILSNLGILELKNNEPDNAKNYFNKILEHDSNDEIALKYLEIINNY